MQLELAINILLPQFKATMIQIFLGATEQLTRQQNKLKAEITNK